MSRRAKFKNKKAESFLAVLPILDVESSGMVSRCKFNFSYLDLNQPLAKPALELPSEFLNELVAKLKNYSTHPLSYWLHQRVGGGGRSILEVYKKFPDPSEFTHPPSVPHDVQWARFRMEGAVRLAGFLIPSSLNNRLCNERKYSFCNNTFYVVFVDLEHGFYG